MNRKMAEIIQHRTPILMAPDATVQEACRAMHGQQWDAILVAEDNGRLLGIFTGDDLLRLSANGISPEATTLNAAMTRAPECLSLRCTAIDAFRLMRDSGLRYIPVVDAAGCVAGLVSDGDVSGREYDERLQLETTLWERIR
jgi:CBS domain-containing protein